jgi:putative CocE/NonD family hydrolase
MNRLWRVSSIWIVLMLAGVGATPENVAKAGEAPEKQIDLLWGQKIPLRDGLKLDATIYKPHDQKVALPVVFTLTPYIADSYLERASYFAKNGYVFALVDVRGRGNSEGQFEPFANEGRDGYDVVEWLAKQPWCDGKVAMWGGSYAGFDQWSTLKEFPPHLKTIVPAAAAHAGIDFPFSSNIFTAYIIQWLTFTSGAASNANLFANSEFWISKFTEVYIKHLPFKELDAVAGNTTSQFQKWIAHPTPDTYWNAIAPTAADYQRISILILTITGHYDGDQAGAMTYYRRHMKYGTPESKANHYLIIGPWDHAGTRTPKREVGGITFGEASVLDLNRIHKEWYDWTMKDGKKPEFLKKRVAYYVPGAAGGETWKYADSLEAISPEPRKLYLSSHDGRANDVFQSGELTSQEAGQEQPDRYVYDALDTRPGRLEQKPSPNDITDQTEALNLFGNGLIYHSEPFPEDTEITGYPRFVTSIAMDVPDTDFAVNVYEIKADGTSIQLTSDLMRARYRDSLTEEKLVMPDEINRYEFDSFQFFSRRIAKGSRLRLLLGCPNSIQLEKNYNSGGVVAAESGKDARTAHISVYHDAQHPSFLEIPVVK